MALLKSRSSQWINAADVFTHEFGEAFRIIQNRGRGMVITGTREWADYTVQTEITPHLAQGFGIAARVQGLERYYALILSDQKTAKLIKRLDGETVLAQTEFHWGLGQSYFLHVIVKGNQISTFINSSLLFTVEDPSPLISGGIALICENGRVGTETVQIGNVHRL